MCVKSSLISATRSLRWIYSIFIDSHGGIIANPTIGVKLKRGHYHAVYELKYHLVLVTKYRRKVFTQEILDKLSTICQDLLGKWDCELVEFGGEADHIHLLISAHPSLELSKLINNLKTVTSRLIRKGFDEHLKPFYWKPLLWTRAYYIASAGGAPLEVIKQYIENQGNDGDR